MEEDFLTVLDPSSVQIVYQMRGISKAETASLLDVLRSARCRGGVCLRFGIQCKSTYYITENATAGDQQMIGNRRQIYGHFGYEPLALLRYCEILHKITTDDCLICCVKGPYCASGKQRLTMFDPCCRVHSFDGVAILRHPYTSQVGATENAFELFYASAVSAPRSSSVFWPGTRQRKEDCSVPSCCTGVQGEKARVLAQIQV